MKDIIERLLDPDFEGPMQHLRDWSEIDTLNKDAADEIRKLRLVLKEVRDCCLYEDDGDLGLCVTEDVVIPTKLFIRICECLWETE